MPSPTAATPAHAASRGARSGAGAPRRRAESTPLRRLSRLVLIIGTVLAALSALGPAWVSRLGLLVAVAAAMVATTAAWREVTEARRSHAAQTLAATRGHGAALSAERHRNAEVVDVLVARAGRAEVEAEQQRVTATELSATIAGLESDLEGLRRLQTVLSVDLEAAHEEIAERELRIAELTELVHAREAELTALSTSTGQLRSMPRRMLTLADDSAALPEADELRRNASADVSDLVAIPVLMPNYEGERKLA